MQGLYQGEFSRARGIIGDGGIWSGEITNGAKFSDIIREAFGAIFRNPQTFIKTAPKKHH